LDSWNELYAHAYDFYLENGHLNVPKYFITSDGYKLGLWIVYQRAALKRGSLSSKQIELLDSIHMIWDLHMYNWLQKFYVVRDYYLKNGNFNNCDSNVRSWVYNQRILFKNTFLPDSYKIDGVTVLNDEQVKLLQSIGFDVGCGLVWRRNFECAQRFFLENGHLNVPREFISSDGFRLGYWISTQRTCFEKNKLSLEQIDLLESIGMIWSLREFNFVKGSLSEYKMITLQSRFVKFMDEYSINVKSGFDSYDDVVSFSNAFLNSIGSEENHYKKR
jgi:hypothetical protein